MKYDPNTIEMKYRPNAKLIIQQGLSPERQVVLEEAYIQLNTLLSRPDLYHDTYGEALAHLTGLEYVLQFLWNFPMDKNKHRYDLEFKECKCPKMDNEELFGTGMRIINADCIVHTNGRIL